MYVPPHFAADDTVTRDLLTHHGAADLVTAGPDGLHATLLPFVLDPDAGEHGALLGHVARQNDHWRTIEAQPSCPALVIVRGPDAYVTPSWYASKAEHGRVVPTWNYVTAHVHGIVTTHHDPAWLERVVRALTDKHENGRDTRWSVDDAPAAFVAGQLRAIVGIELRITHVESKAKLSQNRPAADIDGVVEGFAQVGDASMSAAVASAARRRDR